jgi:N-acetylglucosamine-6-phosphate deacetylase
MKNNDSLTSSLTSSQALHSERSIFLGLKILYGSTFVSNHAVIVEDGIIKEIVAADSIKPFLPAKLYEFPNDHYLIPGLIDLHIHGANGHDVMDGNRQALLGISHALASEGVTGFLATTMTAHYDRINTALTAIAEVMACPQDQGATILGVHLEGPFISRAKMGAQRGDEIISPDPALLSRWQECAKGAIKLVTLAPELPQALELIKKLNQMGITASIGHTDATYAETNLAVNAGCSHATHLFNAMRGIHQREPGATTALLLAENVNAELIVDGLHLHPAIVELALRVKGKNKIILVTDAMRAKCLGDGEYDLGGQLVAVRSNAAKLADGSLAGSTLRMPQAIKNMVQFSHCSLEEAVYMASYNPACALGLEKYKGSIAKDKHADLVVMNADLDVMMTMRNGVRLA